MAAYAKHHYSSHDGLTLFYRSFGAPNGRSPVVCLSGLTRNSRDFAHVASHLANRRWVLCPDFRGRGHSDRDPNYRNYVPATYVRDTVKLLDETAIRRVICIGTSLGGLVSMQLAAEHPERVAGIVLNDVGPEVDPRGLARIRQYVGTAPPVKSWDEAVLQAQSIYGDALPGLSPAAWLAFARQGYREDEAGLPTLDMDPRIGDALREVGGTPSDPWQLWAALRDVPVLVLRGEHSDILSEATVTRMAREKTDVVTRTVPDRGHVPLLNEPVALRAIDDFIDRLP